MASKDKKRKPGKNPVSGPQATPVAEDKAVMAQPVVQPAPVAAKEQLKPKVAKPAPVLTRKPSRLRFFVDAYVELRKAHWPTRREAMRLSLLVAAVCFVVGLLLAGLDIGFSWIMRVLLFSS